MLDALTTKLKLTGNLPSPPAIAMQVVALTSDPNSDTGALASVISKDPSLTAKILRVANSAMYSRGRQSSNLRQAVTLLGLTAASTLALSFTLVNTFKSTGTGGIDYPRFWRRAVLAASAARTFAKGAYHDIEEVFLGALLQDIAVLAVDRVQPNFYANLPHSATHAQLVHHERQLLGQDHAYLTALLVRHWKLPDAIASMAASSHDPATVSDTEPHAAAVRCVALGSECAEVLLANGNESQWRKLAHSAQMWLNLESADLMQAVGSLIAELPETERIFDTSLMDAESARAILEQAGEILLMRNLQALDQVNTLKESAEALIARTNVLEDKHRRDPLTGLFNRGHLDELLSKEFKSAQSGVGPLSVVFVDLDHFKHINDTHGHPTGDAVLVSTAKALLASVRDTDCVARYGGEEFVILFPGLGAEPAIRVCERMLKQLRETQHPTSQGPIRSTASLGLATQTNAGEFAGAAQLIEAADRAVYVAKQSGRDRLAVFDRASLARSTRS